MEYALKLLEDENVRLRSQLKEVCVLYQTASARLEEYAKRADPGLRRSESRESAIPGHRPHAPAAAAAVAGREPEHARPIPAPVRHRAVAARSQDGSTQRGAAGVASERAPTASHPSNIWGPKPKQPWSSKGEDDAWLDTPPCSNSSCPSPATPAANLPSAIPAKPREHNEPGAHKPSAARKPVLRENAAPRTGPKPKEPRLEIPPATPALPRGVSDRLAGHVARPTCCDECRRYFDTIDSYLNPGETKAQIMKRFCARRHQNDLPPTPPHVWEEMSLCSQGTLPPSPRVRRVGVVQLKSQPFPRPESAATTTMPATKRPSSVYLDLL